MQSPELSEAILRTYGDLEPRVAPTAWVAPGAVVVGDVELGEEASVWYGAVVRGDVDRITIGARSNVQDGAVVHVTRGRFPTHINPGGNGQAPICSDYLPLRTTLLSEKLKSAGFGTHFIGKGHLCALPPPPATTITPA